MSPRQRLFFVVTLTTLAIVTGWISYFLAHLDLNDYRQQAERMLSSMLSLSVSIGEIHYSFHNTSLALHVASLKIGDKNSAVQIDAPDILVNLKWRGLLARKLAFSKIRLVEPEVWVRKSLGATDHSQPPPQAIRPLLADQTSWYETAINTLEIKAGAVHIELARPGQATGQIDFTEIDGELSGLRLNHAAQFAITGKLKTAGQQSESPWQLQGESSLLLDESSGLTTRLELDLTVRALDLEELSATLNVPASGYTFRGHSDLRLHIFDSSDEQINFQSELSAQNGEFAPVGGEKKPLLFSNLLVSGQLQTSTAAPRIEALAVQLDESRLSGDLEWSPAGQPLVLNVSLGNSNLQVSQIKQFLELGGESWQDLSKGLKDQGSVKIDTARISLFNGAGAAGAWRIEQLQGEFTELAWTLEGAPAAEILSLPVTFADGVWQFSNGQAAFGPLQFAVDGAIKGQEDSLLSSFSFTGDLRTEQLPEVWPQISEAPFAAKGRVGFSGNLEGPLAELKFDLQADLSQLSIDHVEGLTLEPGSGDKLTLNGSISSRQVSLDHGAIKFNVLKGHGSGHYFIETPEKSSYQALLSIEDLARLAEPLPLLKSLQLRGQADLVFDHQEDQQAAPPKITLTLRDAGLHATDLIADLGQINGRVQVLANGLQADNLQVHLGQSPVSVRARLEDFSKPKLFLDVKSAVIRADELVFSSDKARLKDITGHLEIDRDGLLFAPVDVRLDGGTMASVRGTVSFHPPFDVDLDITSDFVRVGEVIDLWADRPKTSEHEPIVATGQGPEQHQHNSIRINADAKTGDLYGMNFHKATALITPGRRQLVIHPLDFYVGEGFCNAQVIVDFPRDSPSLLRVSGHAEDVDALEVYQELLNQKNIVRGKLRGDFYLAGEIGPRYLPSSHGNFSIAMREGVLHQFPVLSKIFSLLNVSQIFAFQVPDMDREGMPFDTLSANMQLQNGVLSSEDLKIQSRAMNQSYAGQLDLVSKEINLSLAIQPLGTVDKVVSRIPVAGWLLTGDNKSLLTAYLSVTGEVGNTSVQTMPLDTLSEPTMGLLRRTLGLPFKLVEDPQILWGGDGSN